jgi:hypothetical protein
MSAEPNEVERAIARQDRRIYEQSVQNTARAMLASLKWDLTVGLAVADRAEFSEEAKGHWWDNPETGEIQVWWRFRGRAYTRQAGRIYVEREASGRIEWNILGEDGQPLGREWIYEAPPWWRTNFN